jgi:hypothetical protein
VPVFSKGGVLYSILLATDIAWWSGLITQRKPFLLDLLELIGNTTRLMQRGYDEHHN